MSPVSGVHRAVVAGALALAAIPVALFLSGVQTLGQGSFAASSQEPPTPVTTNSPDQKPSKMGVWRHFGESPDAPAAETRQSGGWRHFGEGDSALASPRESLSRRGSGVKRANEMEQLMWGLVNSDRADPANKPETKGRALPLRWNDRLAAVARAHSLDMLNQRYFAHEDAQGRSVAGRIEAAGMEWQLVGENIAINTTISSAETAFMNEPRFSENHRGNILNPAFTDVGIGIVQGPDGRLFITQDFYTALPRNGGRNLEFNRK